MKDGKPFVMISLPGGLTYSGTFDSIAELQQAYEANDPAVEVQFDAQREQEYRDFIANEFERVIREMPGYNTGAEDGGELVWRKWPDVVIRIEPESVTYERAAPAVKSFGPKPHKKWRAPK